MRSNDLVAAIVCTSMFAMIFGIVYLYNRQKMAMIERGMDPRSYKAPSTSAPFRYLKWALLLIGAGTGLFLAAILSPIILKGSDDGNPSIYFSLIGIFGGLGLFVSYMIERKAIEKDSERRIEE